MEFFLNWARLHLALTLTGCNPIYNLYHRRHQFTSVHQFVPSGPVHPDTSIMTCGSLCYVEKISSGPDCDAFTVDPMSGECQIGRFDYGHDLQISDAELTPLWTEDQAVTHVLVLGGGSDSLGVPFDHFEVLQTSGENCRDHGVPDFPFILDSSFDGAMVIAEGHKIFQIGGRTMIQTLDNMWMLNLSQAKPWSWISMAPVPAPRREFLAVTNDVGIYVFGGAESTILDLTDTVFKYSIAGNSWTTLAPTLGAPTRTSGVKVANNRAWVFPFDVSPKQMQIFDLDTETFIGESAILPNGFEQFGYIQLDPTGGLVVAFNPNSANIRTTDAANTGNWKNSAQAKALTEQAVYMATVKAGLSVMVGLGNANDTVLTSQKFDPVTKKFYDTIHTRGLVPMRKAAMVAVSMDFINCTVL